MPSRHSLLGESEAGDDDESDQSALLLRKAFEQFDADGDGKITYEEMQKAQGTLGLQSTFSNKELLALMKETDTDGDGQVDYDEFRESSLRAVSRPEVCQRKCPSLAPSLLSNATPR